MSGLFNGEAVTIPLSLMHPNHIDYVRASLYTRKSFLGIRHLQKENILHKMAIDDFLAFNHHSVPVSIAVDSLENEGAKKP